jgi:hypothetical protein
VLDECIYFMILFKTFHILRRSERDMIKKMYSGLHVQYYLSISIFMKLEFTRHIFENSTNTKFHKNPSSRSRVVPCGRTERRTDTTKLLVIFRNFTNAPKQCEIFRIAGVAADIQM